MKSVAARQRKQDAGAAGKHQEEWARQARAGKHENGEKKYSAGGGSDAPTSYPSCCSADSEPMSSVNSGSGAEGGGAVWARARAEPNVGGTRGQVGSNEPWAARDELPAVLCDEPSALSVAIGGTEAWGCKLVSEEPRVFEDVAVALPRPLQLAEPATASGARETLAGRVGAGGAQRLRCSRGFGRPESGEGRKRRGIKLFAKDI
ncbi:hypothetical protein K438DRAFT_1765396 [Mycena galopus ATCC 62051]|nr:hypothetical protein K438DRAFT_1765396 [Mycena galopus ATCC 62051]